MTKIYCSREISCSICGRPIGMVCLFEDERERSYQNSVCLNCMPDVLRKWDLGNKRTLSHPEMYKFDYTQQNTILDCDRIIEWIENINPSLKVRIGIKPGDKDLP